MKEFTQKHYPALIAWIVIVAIAIIALPNVSALVREKGAVTLPDNAPSQVASRIEKKANGNKAVRTYTAVFSNGDNKLSTHQSKQIDTKLSELQNESGLTVTKVLGPSDNAETKKQLQAKDGTTQLAQITVKNNGQIASQVKKLRSQLKLNGIDTYITGVDALNDDFSTVTEKGIQKTEVIAVIFIFIVLVLVFRSPIVPVISLLNVGVAFITSLSIVMNLVQHFNFPLSNFTQVFLVIVLFGIGTDYNILLYDYFKGQLAAGVPVLDATRETRRHGGRTVLYSGLSVLIGFSSLWLAKFPFYQSASAVAIGVVVLLPVLLTLNMFFMNVLGEKMFWPSKVAGGEGSSKLWHGLSRAAIAQPVVAIAVVLAVGVPFALGYDSELNFNNADEVPSSYQSKAGYLVIQDHFSKGMSAPATIYIKSDKKLDTQAKLAAIDDLTQYLQKEPGIKTVASVTEPGGSKLSQMYLGDQLQTITKGLKASQAGLKKIQSGLGAANSQLSSSDTSQQIAQVKKLASGSSQVQAGLKQYTDGVKAIDTNTQKLASGAQQVASGAGTASSSVKTAASGASALASGSSQVASGARSAASGASALASGASQTASGAQSVASGANTLATGASKTASGAKDVASGAATVASGNSQLSAATSAFTTKLPEMSDQLSQLSQGTQALDTNLNAMNAQMATIQTEAQNLLKVITNAQNQGTLNAVMPSVTKQLTTLTSGISTLAGVATKVNTGVSGFTTAIPELSSNVSTLTSSAAKLAAGSKQVSDGASQVSDGASQVASGSKNLASGSNQVASAANQVASGSTTLAGGSSQVASGASQVSASTRQLASGLNALALGSDTLSSGASQVANGTSQLAAGTKKADDSSATLTSGEDQVNAGVQELNTKLSGMTKQLSALGTGLTDADKGLSTIASGSKTMRSYLLELQNSYMGKDFYLPKSSIHSKAFKPSLDTYMADGKHITYFTVVFKGDPNSTKANTQFTNMKRDLQAKLKHSALKGSTLAIAGQTAQDNDLRSLANGDFQRTATIMLIGIAIALIVVTQSILQPLTILGTLVTAFFASMGITRLFSIHVLGDNLLSWNTPFFTFIMLMALGVDYSIFLMIRFKDDKQEPDLRQRMLKASTTIGAVVLSAAVILGGTFAALIPSGVTTLIQVALGVIFGLIILVILLPIAMSGLVSLNEWHEQKEHETKE
ncbi:MMPL family transporter [Lacticaseibacillus porcinae]|uniref:MMPL family transporter n=1 Tax=Lacticaseibacillus porcinae TaxID=1123687 RepID=UPI0013DDEDCB|nr:MMPL family transporter [Lacticaseibacillus porcinae]